MVSLGKRQKKSPAPQTVPLEKGWKRVFQAKEIRKLAGVNSNTW